METSSNKGAAAETSFFSKVKAELKRLFLHGPGWEASAAATLTYVAPLVETIVALADPEAAPLVTSLIQKVQSAMAAAAVVVKNAGPAPTLVTYLHAINNDLAQVEAVAQIKDAGIAQKLATTVATITTEVNAILLAVPITAV